MRTKGKMCIAIAIAIAVASSVVASKLSPVDLTKAVASVAGLPKDREIITVVVTGYSVDLRQCGKTDGRTAAGVNGKLIRGLAADPTIMPFGTKLDVPGVGQLTVDDTGGDMRQAWRKHGIIHLDLRFIGRNAKKRALAWGRKILRIVVISRPSKH